MTPHTLTRADARRIWLNAQRLTTRAPFGDGPAATRAAIEHLGYVQIDTINVIERCHHHILYTRIPDYRRADLRQMQSIDKSVFEYWTHALAYLPTRDIGFFLGDMRQHRAVPMRWYADADPKDLKQLLRQIRKDGAISIRDIDTDELVEKDHPWGSRKPSKRVLQYGFFGGELTISERSGMLKTYELMHRHFGWNRAPRAATDRQVNAYLLDRALRAQGLISGPSVMHPKLRFTPLLLKLIEARVRKKTLVPVSVDGDATQYFSEPAALDLPLAAEPLVHILSPFDPVVIQRRRMSRFFDYDHVFEAYVPKHKRKWGYFTLPVLVGDEIVAALDLKTDRLAAKLLVQAWHWVGHGNAKAHNAVIEAELDRFEAFQLGDHLPRQDVQSQVLEEPPASLRSRLHESAAVP